VYSKHPIPAPRQNLSRVTRRIVTALIVGLIGTHLVDLACLLLSPTHRISVTASPADPDIGHASEAKVQFALLKRSGFGVVEAYSLPSVNGKVNSIDERGIFVSKPINEMSCADFQQIQQRHWFLSWRVELNVGWPVHCYTGRVTADALSNVTINRAQVPAYPVNVTCDGAFQIPSLNSRVSSWIQRSFCPFKIKFFGLAVDILAIAVCFESLRSGPRWIRSFYRRARKRCPECGYPLHDRMAFGCPECGWNRSP
jgi:hypothetical protein